MRHFIKILLSILLFLVLVIPALASEYMDMDIELGRKILARTLCKSPLDINYVSRVREDVYLFSVFYAKREARFFVGIYSDMIRIQGKEYQTTTRSIPYHFDTMSKCAVVDYSIPDCPSDERIVACSEKTIEEKMDDSFWNRPIPDLLDEDLQRALEKDKEVEPQTGQEDQAPKPQETTTK